MTTYKFQKLQTHSKSSSQLEEQNISVTEYLTCRLELESALDEVYIKTKKVIVHVDVAVQEQPTTITVANVQ